MEYFNNTTHLKTEGRYEDRLYFLTVTSWDKLNKMDKEVAYNSPKALWPNTSKYHVAVAKLVNLCKATVCVKY